MSTHAVLARVASAGTLALLAAVIVFHLRIGGVVTTLWSSHGIHSGDLLGVASAAVALWLVFPLHGWTQRVQARAST